MQPSAADRLVRGKQLLLLSSLSLGLLTACSSTPDDDRVTTTDADEVNAPIPLEYDPTSGAEEGAPVHGGPADLAPANPRRFPVEVNHASGRIEGTGSSSDYLTVSQRSGVASRRKPSPDANSAQLVVSSIDDQLLDLQRTALERLGALIDLQRPLDDLERASMQDHIVQLVALHDLEVGNDSDYHEVLIKAADRLVQPCRRVRLRLAAFFEDIGIDDRAEALWPTKTERFEPSPVAAQSDFSIADVEPTKIIRKGKELDFDGSDLRPGDNLYLFATLDGLTSKPGSRGYQYKYSVEAFVYDEKDAYLGHSPLVKNQLEVSPEPLDPPIVEISYVIPTRYATGNYRLELKITDEFSDRQDVESVALRVRPKSP